jgi:hypothetical protein
METESFFILGAKQPAGSSQFANFDVVCLKAPSQIVVGLNVKLLPHETDFVSAGS